jgi:inhibitor of KinA sporulation pathway (predicted exonuclease)
MVDGQCSFRETLAHFEAWRAEHGLLNNKSAFVTSGDWDLQFLLPHQCRNEGILVPKYCSSWINIKQVSVKFVLWPDYEYFLPGLF